MFHLIDLESQAIAVQELLRGKAIDEKISWLKAHGTVEAKPKTDERERQVYFFVSSMNSDCIFFVDGDEFVFIGHHTTYTAKPSQ